MHAHRIKHLMTAVVLAVVGLLVGLSAVAITSAQARAPQVQTTAPGQYLSVGPTRILDTRIGNGAPAAQVGGGDTLDVTVSGRGGVPAAGVSAVVFNLTVVRPAAGGYVSAFPAGQSAPLASSINFGATQTRAHSVIVAPGAAGQVSLLNGSAGPIDLLVDVVGYYTAGTPTAGGEFGPLTPTRILDTRSGLGAAQAQVTPNASLTVPVVGQGPVPSAGVGMIVLNLTATNATTFGYLSATVNGFATSSSVNFHAGQSDSNLVVIPVSPTGTITVRNAGLGPVDVVADVLGYFVDGAPGAGGRAGGVNPARLLDTRRTHAPIPAFGTITLAVAGHDRVPAAGITAATLNVTVAVPTAAGYLSAYPSNIARPVASSVNFSTSTVANEVLAPLGTDGAVRIYNGSAKPVQVVVDVSGYVGPVPGPLTWSGRIPNPGTSAVHRVSCGSSTFCMALADDGAYRFDGHTWSSLMPLPPYVGRASCVATGFCMALTSSGPYAFDGTTWHASSFPGDPSTLTGVSCASSTFCVAPGYGEHGALSWIFNGSSWTSTAIGAVLTTSINVSCASPTFCLLVDNAGASWRFNGTVWTSSGSNGLADTSAVSCVSATFCMSANDGHAIRFDGTHWGSPVTLGVETSLSDSVVAVSCTSTTFCLAATSFGYQLMWNGVAWTTEMEVDPAAVNLQNVSCATPTFCVVVDVSGAVVGTLT